MRIRVCARPTRLKCQTGYAFRYRALQGGLPWKRSGVAVVGFPRCLRGVKERRTTREYLKSRQIRGKAQVMKSNLTSEKHPKNPHRGNSKRAKSTIALCSRIRPRFFNEIRWNFPQRNEIDSFPPSFLPSFREQ